jgi:hypothetical protein
MWEEERTAIGRLWITQDGGAQWRLVHEAPGRLVVTQALADGFLVVREVYTEGRTPPLRHQLELLVPSHEAKVLGVIPALVREICFITPARGYVCTVRDVYWTENGGRDWRKVSTRTADPFTGKLQSVAADGSIYFIRSNRVFEYSPTSRVELPVVPVPNLEVEAVSVDREKAVVLIAGKRQGEWVSVSVSKDLPGEILPIGGADADDLGHTMHAENGQATLVTISTARFLPRYASFLYQGGRWRREDTGDARNFGALAFAGGRVWVARRSPTETATRLYCRR